MMMLVTYLQNLRGDRRGISALEYGILGVVVVTAVATLGPTLTGTFANIFQELNEGVTAAGGTAATGR